MLRMKPINAGDKANASHSHKISNIPKPGILARVEPKIGEWQQQYFVVSTSIGSH